jgi:hypothetical protein
MEFKRGASDMPPFWLEKEELGKRLYHLYNKEIFGESLPADMEITWNVR